MALKAAATPLVIALTQGGADAFVQGSVLTGLSGRQAYNLKSVEIEPATLTTWAQLLAADSSVEIALTRRSKAAMPTIADNDVLFKQTFVIAFTTSGAAFVTLGTPYNFALEMPIVEDTIYAQLDSTTTGVVLGALVRMNVELDTMSDIDRLNLIARSLS